MTLYPKIQLSRLRSIGWGLWDPIGLRNADGTWDDACADEYDRYLLSAVSQLCRGRTRLEVAAYLMDIATEHMGLSLAGEKAASATSVAIADYLVSLPDGPESIE